MNGRKSAYWGHFGDACLTTLVSSAIPGIITTNPTASATQVGAPYRAMNPVQMGAATTTPSPTKTRGRLPHVLNIPRQHKRGANVRNGSKAAISIL
jgi:hypothetical protein